MHAVVAIQRGTRLWRRWACGGTVRQWPQLEPEACEEPRGFSGAQPQRAHRYVNSVRGSARTAEPRTPPIARSGEPRAADATTTTPTVASAARRESALTVVIASSVKAARSNQLHRSR
eukprot:7380545-Prymnesium_polylepis.1